MSDCSTQELLVLPTHHCISASRPLVKRKSTQEKKNHGNVVDAIRRGHQPGLAHLAVAPVGPAQSSKATRVRPSSAAQPSGRGIQRPGSSPTLPVARALVPPRLPDESQAGGLAIKERPGATLLHTYLDGVDGRSVRPMAWISGPPMVYHLPKWESGRRNLW